MKLSEELNKIVNEALELLDVPNEIIADFVTQFGIDDLWAAYCTSDRFKKFLAPYDSFKAQFEEFYKNNEEAVDTFLLEVPEYQEVFVKKAKKEGIIFNAYVEGMIWHKLEQKGFVDEEGHIDPDLTPFYISFRTKSAVTDERTGEEIEKLGSREEAYQRALELNKEHALQMLNA